MEEKKGWSTTDEKNMTDFSIKTMPAKQFEERYSNDMLVFEGHALKNEWSSE